MHLFYTYLERDRLIPSVTDSLAGSSSSSKLYLFRVTHFSNTILVSHETLRIIYNIFTMKEYYIYTTMHLKDDDTNVKA